MYLRRIRPSRIRRETTNCAVLPGMAKQIPVPGDDRGVNADDFSGRINEWPARIARVQSRIGLDHPVDQPAGLRAERSARLLMTPAVTVYWNPYGIADRDRELPYFQPGGVSELNRCQVRRIDVQDGKIGVRILADELCRIASPIGKRHANQIGAMDDVAVGQDEAIGRKDEPRPAPAHLPTARRWPGGGVCLTSMLTTAGLALCRTDHRLGIGIKQRRI